MPCPWLLLLAPVLSAAASKPDRVAPRIVGGTEIDAHSHPFLVRLYFEDGEGFCGGSLVSGQWVLSAAHCCVAGGDDVSIFVGIHKHYVDSSFVDHTCTELIAASSVVVHPSYNDAAAGYDVCLLQLASEPECFGPADDGARQVHLDDGRCAAKAPPPSTPTHPHPHPHALAAASGPSSGPPRSPRRP